MRKYTNILVVYEPKRDKQVALERALDFARYNSKVNITVLRLVYDYSQDIHLVTKSYDTSREEVTAQHIATVEKTINEYKKDATVNIRPKVLWTRELGEGIVDEMNSGSYDVLIKGANHHGILDSIIFTPIDWYVLRNARIPVIIAKEHEWTPGRPIVVAVDFTSEDKRRYNVSLLREAQLLATITGGTIHLVNSAPVVLPAIMLEVPNYAPEIYAENILKEHKKRLLEFAAVHNVPAERCHIAEGLPDDVIPALCKSLKPEVVFIGSAGRQGMAAALVGNTCEEIVDYIDADLIVLNHGYLDEPVKNAE